MAHWWRQGGSLVDMCWLIGVDVVARRSCVGALVEMRWLIGDVFAHWRRCVVSGVELSWHIGGDEVAHW